jgi:hypothetical protein
MTNRGLGPKRGESKDLDYGYRWGPAMGWTDWNRANDDDCKLDKPSERSHRRLKGGESGGLVRGLERDPPMPGETTQTWRSRRWYRAQSSS